MVDSRPGETDIERILEVLAEGGVRFVVIGGVAAVLHGSPYATYDLDVCVATDDTDLEALADALRALDAKEWDPRKEEVEREWSVEMLSSDRTWLLTTRHGPLDVLFMPAGTRGYKDLAARARAVDVDGVRVQVVSIEDLIRMKEAAGRERDLLHLSTLRKIADRTRPGD